MASDRNLGAWIQGRFRIGEGRLRGRARKTDSDHVGFDNTEGSVAAIGRVVRKGDEIACCIDLDASLVDERRASEDLDLSTGGNCYARQSEDFYITLGVHQERAIGELQHVAVQVAQVDALCSGVDAEDRVASEVDSACVDECGTLTYEGTDTFEDDLLAASNGGVGDRVAFDDQEVSDLE